MLRVEIVIYTFFIIRADLPTLRSARNSRRGRRCDNKTFPALICLLASLWDKEQIMCEHNHESCVHCLHCCSMCGKVYCCKCGKEWGDNSCFPCVMPHLAPYYPPCQPCTPYRPDYTGDPPYLPGTPWPPYEITCEGTTTLVFGNPGDCTHIKQCGE